MCGSVASCEALSPGGHTERLNISAASKGGMHDALSHRTNVLQDQDLEQIGALLIRPSVTANRTVSRVIDR